MVSSVVKTLIEPKKFFSDLVDQPSFWRPFMIIVLSGVMLTSVTFPFTLKELTDLLALNSSFTTSAIVFIIFTLIICGSLMIEWVMLSVFIYFILALLSPSVSNFRTVFSMTGYTWVPIILKTLSFAALVLITGEVFEPVGLLALFPNLENNIAVSILNQIEPFIIWQYALLYFGVKVLLKSRNHIVPLAIAGVTFMISLTFKVLPGLMTSFI